jgi:hypothetical protein
MSLVHNSLKTLSSETRVLKTLKTLLKREKPFIGINVPRKILNGYERTKTDSSILLIRDKVMTKCKKKLRRR